MTKSPPGTGLLLAGVLVVVLAEVSRQLAFSDQSLSLLWPIAGYGAVMLYRWGVSGLAALAGGLMIWSLWRYGMSPSAALAATLAGVAGPLVVWAATSRAFALQASPFEHTATVVRWLKVELGMGAPLAATLGVFALGIVAPSEEQRTLSVLAVQWAAYWIIEACGALLVAPVAWHLMIGPAGSRLAQRLRLLGSDLLAHRALLWLSPLMAALLAAVFGLGDVANARAFSYLLLPMLLVVAHQCRPVATHAHVMFAGLLVTAASAFAMTHARMGEVGAGELIELILLVLFLLVSAAVLMVLVTVYAERRQAREQLERQAFIDPLTGLLNDAGLARTYGHKPPGHPPALVLLRVGNWRAIEYLDGPAALNRLEEAAARELVAAAPEVLWARTSPGRFVGLSLGEPVVADRLQRWQTAVVATTAREGGQAQPSMVRPLWRACAVQADPGADPPDWQTLVARLRETDLSQSDGADAMVVPVLAGDGHRLRETAAMVERVRQAIAERRLRLVAQPIVPLSAPAGDARPSAEILVRLLDEEGREWPPARFMTAALRGGLMPLLDAAVIEMSLAALARHRSALSGIDYCSINLSGATLARADLAERLEGDFACHGISPERVVFEITESQAIAQPREAAASLDRLRARGFRVAIDDFGTGHATFDYLKRFRVDLIKIDGAFIRELERQPLDRVIVRSMVEVARLLEVKTVAEFVDSDILLDWVRKLGIDSAQGYHLGRPQPLEDWLAALTAVSAAPSLAATGSQRVPVASLSLEPGDVS